MRRITDQTCTRCGHGVTEHLAESELPELPGMMPCDTPGCECVDFHRCDLPTCAECALHPEPV